MCRAQNSAAVCPGSKNQRAKRGHRPFAHSDRALVKHSHIGGSKPKSRLEARPNEMVLANRELLGEGDSCAAGEAEDAGGVAFVHGNFDEAAGAEIGKRLRAIALREGFDKLADGLISRLQIDGAAGEGTFRQVFLAEISDQVAKR